MNDLAPPQDLTPRQIGDDESDRRSVKAGWYAIRRNGSIRLGPFSSRQKCLSEIEHAKPEEYRNLAAPGFH